MTSAWRRYRPCPRPCEGLRQQPGHLLQKLLHWQRTSWLPTFMASLWYPEARVLPRWLQQLLHGSKASIFSISAIFC